MARRKLDQLNQAAVLGDLRAPPSNRLEKLKGERGRREYQPLWELLENLLRWQHMLVSVLQETGEASDRIFVDYDTLVEDPLGQARRLAEVLDQYCGRTSDAARIAAMAATCDPALRRIRSAPASARREVAPAQAALYRLLRQRAADIGVSSGTYPMPDDWRALVITEEAATRT